MQKWHRYVPGHGAGGTGGDKLKTKTPKPKSNLQIDTNTPKGNPAEIQGINEMTAKILGMTDNKAIRLAVKKEVGRVKGNIKKGYGAMTTPKALAGRVLNQVKGKMGGNIPSRYSNTTTAASRIKPEENLYNLSKIGVKAKLR